MKLNEHSGEMRFTHGYENNQKLCEEKYKVKFNEDRKTFKCEETGKNLQKLKYDFLIMR